MALRFLLAALLQSSSVHAGGPHPGVPAPRRSRALAPLDSIDRYVRAELARQRIPGLSVAVLRGDSLLLARGYGALPRGRLPGELGGLMRPSRTWTWKGCDDVAGRRLERLGSPIARICYAAGAGPEVSSLVEVDYTGDGRAAFVDWYDF